MTKKPPPPERGKNGCEGSDDRGPKGKVGPVVPLVAGAGILGGRPAETKERTCAVCGCSERDACSPHGCAWVCGRPSLCSVCLTFLINIRDLDKLRQVLAVFGLPPELARSKGTGAAAAVGRRTA